MVALHSYFNLVLINKKIKSYNWDYRKHGYCFCTILKLKLNWQSDLILIHSVLVKRWMQLYFISTAKLLQCCIIPLAHLQFNVYLFILNKFLWMQLRVTHLVWGVRDKGINFLFFLPWGYKLACRLLFIGTPQSADNKQSSYSCTPLGSRQSDSQKNTHP